MHLRPFLALTLAAALVSPASADDRWVKTPFDASAMASAVVVVVPLVLASYAGHKISEASSAERMANNRRWEVTKVRPQGARTAIEMRSKDEALKIDMAVATTTARSQKLQVRDQLEIEAVGNAGYAVRKGATTIGVLAQPGSGMVHSQAR